MCRPAGDRENSASRSASPSSSPAGSAFGRYPSVTTEHLDGSATIRRTDPTPVGGLLPPERSRRHREQASDGREKRLDRAATAGGRCNFLPSHVRTSTLWGAEAR